MGWLYLSIAIVFEVIGTTQLKRTEGNFFTSAGMLMLLLYAISFFMLTQALKNDIEMGVGYAIWSGVGTALIAIIGVTAFGEQASVMKFLCIMMIIIGVAGLKLFSDKVKVDQQNHSPDQIAIQSKFQSPDSQSSAAKPKSKREKVSI